MLFMYALAKVDLKFLDGLSRLNQAVVELVSFLILGLVNEGFYVAQNGKMM